MDGFTKVQRGATAVLRIATGLVFLTAGIDKAIIAGKAFDATGFLSQLTDYIGRTTPDNAHALLQAQAEIVHVAVSDSMTLAFNDIFRVMSWVFFAALVMVPFCRPLLAAATAAPPPDAH